jgi:hypothetical protein
MYTIERYLAPALLKERGVAHFETLDVHAYLHTPANPKISGFSRNL